MEWVLHYVGNLPDDESVALLHVKGGGYFDFARQRLRDAGIPFVEMQGRPEWPRGPEQVGLCTLHSAKGLEFDHVVILGLSADQMPHGPADDDAQLAQHRRLVAMGMTRARKSAALTYKPEEASRVVDFLDPDTFDGVDV
jgi:superfamily I DNA/RNA helicase